MDLKGYNIILSSGSPRRKELLLQSGIPFRIRLLEVEESFPDQMPVDEIAQYIAEKKATAHAGTLEKNDIILTADTVVSFQNKIFGKPKNEAEALEMILKLSGNHHDVYTGVCFYCINGMDSFTCKSVVKFSAISKSEAKYYIDNFNPMDKAGSYGIQDWLGTVKVEWINGSYTNIFGLPLAQTLTRLNLFLENKQTPLTS
jgi:septum formation protein